MNVVVRADASVQLGAGHVMRCLTLADALRQKGARVSFICCRLTGNLIDFIQKKGYQAYTLPVVSAQIPKGTPPGWEQCLRSFWEADAEWTKAVLAGEERYADWLIVDHYSFDSRWESIIRPFVKRIMVIDDLAERPHDCDILLDQNFYNNINSRYKGLVPDNCIKLLGPRYALLRPEFKEARKNLLRRDGIVRRILVFFGSSDPTNETVKALEAIRLLKRPDIAVDVVVGESNPNKDRVSEICFVSQNTRYYCQVENMALLMAKADLAIGSGGSTTWERCFLGLPTITLVIAENQSETTAALAAEGAVWALGRCRDVSAEMLAVAINKALDNPAALVEMGKKAMDLMGGSLSCNENAVIQFLTGENNVGAR